MDAFRFGFAGRSYALASPLPDASIARDPTLYRSGNAALDAAIAREGVDAVTAAIDDPARTLRSPLPDGRGAAHVAAVWTSATEGTVRVEGVGGAVVVLRRA